MIHSTAIINPKAKIDSGVEIGPYSIIGENVFIESGTVIGPHVVIDPYVTIGSDCNIFQYAAIGASPQSLKFEGGETYVKIGRGTIVREFVTIHRGTEFGGGITEVGEENFLMAYTHIAHDCKTGRKVVLSNNATLAGHITIGDNATIGGLVAIHQFVRAKLHGLNSVGLKRHGFSENTLSSLKKTYRIIFRIGLTMNEAIERVRAEVEQIPEVLGFIDFIKSSQRGITR